MRISSRDAGSSFAFSGNCLFTLKSFIVNEDFFQYIWKMKLFNTSSLMTTDGEAVVLFHNGEHNLHAGPDFTNARIRIGETVWAGNVELHIRSSDWHQHRHSGNRAYDNVILHVVYEDDAPEIPMATLVLKDHIDQHLLSGYAVMMQTAAWIPCEKNIRGVEPVIIKNQLSRLLHERLESKALQCEQRLMVNKGDWEETCYQMIARNFGTNVNADPFERVARSLPFRILLRHFNQPFQIEALLFGQAGFLEAGFRELYPNQLQSEYRFLRTKYELESIRSLEWKFLRMRPANFPTIRMSQFANFMSQHEKLFSVLLATTSIADLRSHFSVSAAHYWKEHYHFKKSAPVKSTLLGKDTVDLILMNTISPLFYLYGKMQGQPEMQTRAIEILENIPAETNSIIHHWKEIGVAVKHASDSQALLELKNRYCSNRRCLECTIGHRILRGDVKEDDQL